MSLLQAEIALLFKSWKTSNTMHTYVCVYTYTYICMHTHICMRVYIYKCSYVLNVFQMICVIIDMCSFRELVLMVLARKLKNKNKLSIISCFSENSNEFMVSLFLKAIQSILF